MRREMRSSWVPNAGRIQPVSCAMHIADDELAALPALILGDKSDQVGARCFRLYRSKFRSLHDSNEPCVGKEAAQVHSAFWSPCTQNIALLRLVCYCSKLQ